MKGTFWQAWIEGMDMDFGEYATAEEALDDLHDGLCSLTKREREGLSYWAQEWVAQPDGTHSNGRTKQLTRSIGNPWGNERDRTMKIAIYNENCVMAGRQVDGRKLKQAEADNEGRDCDSWEGGDWTLYVGTPQELLELAELADLTEQAAVRGSFYRQRVAQTIRDAVYAEEPDLEPEPEDEGN